jgi:hypothetical protein
MLEGNHAFGCLLGQLTVSAAHAAQFNDPYGKSSIMESRDFQRTPTSAV